VTGVDKSAGDTAQSPSSSTSQGSGP
jgi:hypothetical protein